MSVLPAHLETARMRLRPLRAHDVEAVLAYAVDREFGRFVAMPFPYRRADAEAFVARGVATDWAIAPAWAIERDGQVVGSIHLEVDPAQRRARLGLGIARAHWRQGLGAEAARAAVDWAFATLPITRVYATADARDVAGQQLLTALGMQHEATLRLHRTQRRIQVDEVWYGLLRVEWSAAHAIEGR